MNRWLSHSWGAMSNRGTTERQGLTVAYADNRVAEQFVLKARYENELRAL